MAVFNAGSCFDYQSSKEGNAFYVWQEEEARSITQQP